MESKVINNWFTSIMVEKGNVKIKKSP